MKKSESLNYKIGRSLSSSVFKLTMNPKILNGELIPKNGPIIICGNHLHVWDQFPVMCATNRTIHWLAKKEYFDGKMGPIFKFMECIPVDRKGNTSTSKDIAIKYLKNGSAVGIFPEGTRNGLKEQKINDLFENYESDISYEQFKKDLLKDKPRLSSIELLENLYNKNLITKEEFKKALLHVDKFLKELTNNNKITINEYNNAKLLKMYSGAIKMAKVTDALLVPFGVTGDYKVGNDNLVVNFGNPINIQNMDVDSATNHLRNAILNLVLENEKSNKKLIKKQ